MSTAASTPSPLPSSTPAPTNSGPTSSPLLFFVALGFGVVFTNLWIIVGVKYCFRYNQRNRQRQLGEDGTPIDMLSVPRPQRRRREKKLMTMDEVNERFPLMKYKAWRASRAAQGLSTEGGVTAPQSRAASVKDVEGVAEPAGRNSQDSTTGNVRNTLELARHDHASKPAEMQQTATPRAQSPQPASTSRPASPVAEPSSPKPPPTFEGAKSPVVKTEQNEGKPAESDTLHTPPAHARESSDEGSDAEDDPIRAPVPPEMLSMPGDTCAICIDNLEDDDDVRGLTCGHAFHAACLDPWLTSRRACCPLCKADYYVPKPRPEGEATTNPPQQPSLAYFGAAGRGGLPFRILSGPRFFMGGDSPRAQQTANSTTVPQGSGRVQAPARPVSGSSGWRGRMLQISRLNNPLRRSRDQARAQTAGQDAQATPRELEEGSSAAATTAPTTTSRPQ